MCGIVGLIDLEKRLGNEEIARLTVAMRDAMLYRGPDAEGLWVDPAGTCALGHRRLAIIDLSPDGRQPMQGVGVDTVVTYNGEIYNYLGFRRRLEARGVTFKSKSDTEILPHLFETLDCGPLSALSGMFAMAVWKRGAQELLLARDAFGKKPLYVYEDRRFFAFASEIHAFYALPGFDDEIDERAIADYLLLGYMPGPRTVYRRVRQVEPGSFERWSFVNGAKRKDAGQFFRFHARERESVSAIDKRALRERLKTQLIEAVEERLMSDVPLGAFLSGGVDSSLVAAVVCKALGKPLNTYSIGFEGSDESEHEAAREIARHIGTTHHDAMLRPDGLSMIERIAQALDQPNGDSSCLPTYLLSEFTRRHVTVALSGDGGDELFGGYGRYRDTMNELSDPDLLRRAHGFDPAKATVADLYMSLRWHIFLPAQAAAMMGGRLPEETRARLDGFRRQLNDPSTPPLHRLRTIDANVYMPGSVLPKVDRMSMQHALEVRCPLLDIRFAETAMGLSQDDCWAPPAATKKILKDITSDFLPAEWLNRPKKGFGLPANAWGKEEIISLCRSAVSGAGALGDFLDRRAVATIVDQQMQPGAFSIYQMWPIATLDLWFKAQPQKKAAARRHLEAA